MDEFIESDIIEKVPKQEAIDWCSLLVVQPKTKHPESEDIPSQKISESASTSES